MRVISSNASHLQKQSSRKSSCVWSLRLAGPTREIGWAQIDCGCKLITVQSWFNSVPNEKSLYWPQVPSLAARTYSASKHWLSLSDPDLAATLITSDCIIWNFPKQIRSSKHLWHPPSMPNFRIVRATNGTTSNSKLSHTKLWPLATQHPCLGVHLAAKLLGLV